MPDAFTLMMSDELGLLGCFPLGCAGHFDVWLILTYEADARRVIRTG